MIKGSLGKTSMRDIMLRKISKKWHDASLVDWVGVLNVEEKSDDRWLDMSLACERKIHEEKRQIPKALSAY